MNSTRNKAILLTTAFSFALLNLVACAQAGKKPQTDRELRGRGLVVRFDLAKGAQKKEGIDAITDAGNWLFSTFTLSKTGGGTLSFGGGKASFPRWVRVTWRQGPGVDINSKTGLFMGGTLIGDYKVEVLSRIPEEVFKYVAAARGRAIMLRFRFKDDGVLFAWDVEETVFHPEGGSGFVYSLHGGDFPCDSSPSPDCTEGQLKNAPWYNPLWTNGNR